MNELNIVLVSKDNPQAVITTLNSLLSIDNLIFKVVIVDSSKNDSVKRVFSYFSKKIRITYFWDEPKGIYSAMNFAINRIAKNEIIWFLNPGDLLFDKNVLSICINSFEDLEVDFVIAQASYSNNPFILFPSKSIESNLANMISGKFSFSHQAMLVKSKLIKEELLFNIQYELASDFEQQFRLIKTYNGVIVEKKLVELDPNGASHNKIVKLIFETSLILYRNNYFGILKTVIFFVSKLISRLKKVHISNVISYLIRKI